MCHLLGSTWQDDRVWSCCFNLHPLPVEHTSCQKLHVNAKFPFDGCRRILASRSPPRPPQRGPDPSPLGSDSPSPVPWPADSILAASLEDIAAAAPTFIELMNLRDILSIAQIKKYFLQPKIDWFGTKTAARYPSDNSLKLQPIYPFISVLALLQLRQSKEPAHRVICSVFQMKNMKNPPISHLYWRVGTGDKNLVILCTERGKNKTKTLPRNATTNTLMSITGHSQAWTVDSFNFHVYY